MACVNHPTGGDIVTIQGRHARLPKPDLSKAFPAGVAKIERVDGALRVDASTGYTTKRDKDGNLDAEGLFDYRHSHKVWKDGKPVFYRDEGGIIHFDNEKGLPRATGPLG